MSAPLKNSANVSAGAKRLGVFGGSFNPPHLGHLRAALAFHAAMALDETLIVPAGEPPLREALQGAAAADRLALCEATFGGCAGLRVSGMELQRPGKSYTVRTLRRLRCERPEAKLFLLVGSDQLARFERWHAWREILRLCTVCSLARGAAAAQLPPALAKAGARTEILDGFAPLEISATKLRAALAAGEDVSAWLAPQALRIINERGLYRVGE
jgi:nicotinate-nucleotide adenylyltransferase